jgi:hypothetical protein
VTHKRTAGEVLRSGWSKGVRLDTVGLGHGAIRTLLVQVGQPRCGAVRQRAAAGGRS